MEEGGGRNLIACAYMEVASEPSAALGCEPFSIRFDRLRLDHGISHRLNRKQEKSDGEKEQTMKKNVKKPITKLQGSAFRTHNSLHPLLLES